MTLPFSCFCFATLYLTINNFQRSKSQHQTAECGSYHNLFLESLKAERPGKGDANRAQGLFLPHRGKRRAGDHKAMAKAALFSRLMQHHLWTKRLHFSGVLFGDGRASQPHSLSIACAARSARGAAGLEALCIPFDLIQKEISRKPKKVNERERLALNCEDQRPRKPSFA